MGERKNLWGREEAIGNFLSSFISPNRYSFKEGEASKDEFERFRGFFLRERRGGNYDWFNLKFRRRGQEKGVIKCRYNSM